MRVVMSRLAHAVIPAIKLQQVESVHEPVPRLLSTLTTPLLFDPGDKGECGSSLDWCGRVLEGIRGKRLGEVIGKRIFQPLGVKDITFSMTTSMRSCLAATYAAQRAQAAA